MGTTMADAIEDGLDDEALIGADGAQDDGGAEARSPEGADEDEVGGRARAHVAVRPRHARRSPLPSRRPPELP